jgi:hypothetical protein
MFQSPADLGRVGKIPVNRQQSNQREGDSDLKWDRTAGENEGGNGEAGNDSEYLSTCSALPNRVPDDGPRRIPRHAVQDSVSYAATAAWFARIFCARGGVA